MRHDQQERCNVSHPVQGDATPSPRALEVVIPFTTPDLTRRAIQFSEHMAGGLSARLRLLRIQLVPFPAPLEQSPVALRFLESQMLHLPCELPHTIDIRLAREFEAALREAVTPECIVVLAYKRRPWLTHQQRLAARLEAAGFHVILVSAEVPLERSKQHA